MISMIEKADVALARSVLWQAISFGFQPPEPVVIERLHGAEGLAALQAAAATAHPGLAQPLNEMASRPAPTVSEHVRIFGHSLRGVLSPYELEWGAEDLFSKPHDMADLGGFLEAFGLALDRGRHERVDHVSCQAELMGFLAAREARALEHEAADATERVREAERLLLRDHLARFVPALATSLATAGGDGFYGAFGRVAGALTEAECQAFGVPPGSAALTLRPTDLDDQPYDCGSGDGLVQIQIDAGRSPRP